MPLAAQQNTWLAQLLSGGGTGGIARGMSGDSDPWTAIRSLLNSLGIQLPQSASGGTPSLGPGGMTPGLPNIPNYTGAVPHATITGGELPGVPGSRATLGPWDPAGMTGKMTNAYMAQAAANLQLRPPNGAPWWTTAGPSSMPSLTDPNTGIYHYELYTPEYEKAFLNSVYRNNPNSPISQQNLGQPTSSRWADAGYSSKADWKAGNKQPRIVDPLQP